jgi:hypothetical protein
MPTSVRLDPKSEVRLRRLAHITGRTKSELIREAIERLDATLSAEGSTSTYERLKPFLGVYRSGTANRAARAEDILREGFGRKKKP